MSRAHRKSAIRAAALAGLASTVLCCRAEAAAALTQLSSDPYTNATSFHATEVEPDTFAYGPSLVATFQGASAKVGLQTSAGPPQPTRARPTRTGSCRGRPCTQARPAPTNVSAIRR